MNSGLTDCLAHCECSTSAVIAGMVVISEDRCKSLSSESSQLSFEQNQHAGKDDEPYEPDERGLC